MARPSQSAAVRLKKLEGLRSALRALPRGTILSLREMHELLGVSRSTLREWTDTIPAFEESGAFGRGAEGVEYEFCPVRTLWFLIDHFAAIVDGQREKNRSLKQSVGVTLPESDSAASFQETKELVNLTIAVTSAAKEQGRYTPTEQMIAFVSGYNQAVVSGVLGIRTKIDPNGTLPPDVREHVDAHLRLVASDAYERAATFIEERSADLQQAGAGRAGNAAGRPPVLPGSGRNRRKAA